MPSLPEPSATKPIPIDSSAKFRGGAEYRDVVEFHKYLRTLVNRDRFVRCFITKQLTYANDIEPDHHAEIEKILQPSAAREAICGKGLSDRRHDCRGDLDSRLFREE